MNKKLQRLKEAYLNEVITLAEYNNDKKELEDKITDLNKKENSDKEMDNYSFTFEDVMLRNDELAEQLKDKNMINYIYTIWTTMPKEEKKDFIMKYIDSIEIEKYDKKIILKRILG